jgi:hypothetical protein
MAINNTAVPGKTENALPESKTNQKIQKGGPINTILVILVLVVVGTGVFMFFQKGKVMARTNQLDEDIKGLKTQVAQMKDNKVEFSKNASDALAQIEKDELRWSEVIAAVNKQLPVDASGNRKINVISYSGSGDGKLALNMVTQPSGIPPYDDVSQLIAGFNNSVFFKDAYVPAISKGTNVDGSTTLSFILNLSYQKPDTGSSNLDLGVTGVTDASTIPAPKVARPQ